MVNIEVTHETTQVEIASTGTQGLQGPQGIQGPAGADGPPGLGTQVSFSHLTAVAAQTITSSNFNTIMFEGNPNTNIGGGSWTSGSLFTVPMNGRYLITARVRITDNQSSRSTGVGVHTTNADGPWFTWREVGGTGSKSRDTIVYSRVDSFTTGQQLRLYIYSDGLTFPVSAAALTIDRIGN